MRKNLIDCLKHVGSGLELELTKNAYALYASWYENIETSIHAKRLDTYSLRLMMLLSVNNLIDKIDAEIVKQAIKLCNWQLVVRKLHDPVDADTKIGQMEEKMRRLLNQDPLSDRELKRRTNYNRYGLWYFDSARKNLQRHHEIEWNKESKKWQLKN